MTERIKAFSKVMMCLSEGHCEVASVEDIDVWINELQEIRLEVQAKEEADNAQS